MLKVALTGGIATGKSVVVARLRQRGVPVIVADRLVHEALSARTDAAARVVSRFGDSVRQPDGSIDRVRLGAIVFADAAARRDLEAILHPAVYDSICQFFNEQERTGARLCVAEIPLLYETGHEREFDCVVVTACDPEEQVRRIVARDGLTETEARRRLAAQLPVSEKARRADYVIRTDGTLEETRQRTDDTLERLGSRLDEQG